MLFQNFTVIKCLQNLRKVTNSNLQIRRTYAVRDKKTHYEVLNLNRNCSSQDIKNAFITLSKKFHPDKNKSKGAHAQYTRIVEAYSVLGKPETRRLYDSGLSYPTSDGPFTVYTHYPFKEEFYGPGQDTSFWENRDKSKDKFYEGRSYYGIKGIPRLPNGWIAAACFLFAILGVSLQALLIKKSLTLKREGLLRKSAEAESVLYELKRQAEENGNKKQIELVKERLQQNKHTQYPERDYDSSLI